MNTTAPVPQVKSFVLARITCDGLRTSSSPSCITKETALIIRNISRPINGRINRKTTRDELLERYRKVCAKSKEDRLLERYILAANSVFNFVNEHNLDKLDQKEVEHLRTIVGKINDILNPFNKRIIKEVKNTRRRYDNV